eukprot:TRINITY_DN1357_c0_g1_i15.p1 TRINITY_DN1357_c0_g1~~TRINITY_DN1357_c0_g1_i15.p1  ORF type:complete len:406 (+),score=55.97 TRINITY_DN1357_c0_g1_i15:246-1463(+)
MPPSPNNFINQKLTLEYKVSMNEPEIVYDPDFVVILDEGDGISLLPSSCVRSHESRNPFKPQGMGVTEELTPRYSILPRKLSAAEGYIPLIEINSRDLLGSEKKSGYAIRRISQGDIDSVEPEEEPRESATPFPMPDKKRDKMAIKPYQTKMTEELERYFSKLVQFKGIDESWVREHKVKLSPQRVPRKTLVLDLDGTLICNIHSASCEFGEGLGAPEVVTTRCSLNGTAKGTISFYVRPHVAKLLKTLRLFYEIVVFTASTEAYGKAVVEYLDPRNCCIQYLLHRAHCVMTKSWIVKDLRVLGRRDPKDIVILENSVVSFAANLDNGIYVPSYEGGNEDEALLPIIDFLKEIANVGDVRPYVKEFAGITKLFADYKAKACLFNCTASPVSSIIYLHSVSSLLVI